MFTSSCQFAIDAAWNRALSRCQLHSATRTARCAVRARREREDSFFSVRRVSPPRKDIGFYHSPSLVACGETIEIAERQYVIERVSSHWRLVRGKYVRDVQRLHVTELSRWLTQRSLEELLLK